MVQLTIKSDNPSEKWMLIDLQGVIESNTQSIAGLHIGNITFG